MRATHVVGPVAWGIVGLGLITPAVGQAADAETMRKADVAAVVKLDAAWVLDRLGKADSKTTQLVVAQLREKGALSGYSDSVVDRLTALEIPSEQERSGLAAKATFWVSVLESAWAERGETERANAAKQTELVAKNSLRRDVLAETRSYPNAPREGEGAAGRPRWTTDYFPEIYRNTTDPDERAALVEEKFSRSRTSIAGRVGYEVTNLPGDSEDDGGVFVGLRYYSEGTVRLPFFEKGRTGSGQATNGLWRRGEVDMFFDLNYRNADTAADDEGTGENDLRSVNAINFTAGLYVPFYVNPVQASLLDFHDSPDKPWSEVRGELGLIIGAGIKALIDDNPWNDYQKFGGIGLRAATFRPTAPDPIRHIDLIYGYRTDLNNPRLRVESNFLLYEFKRGVDTPGSRVNLYGFGAAEIDLDGEGENAQDILTFGFYLRYEFDRIEKVFGSFADSILP